MPAKQTGSAGWLSGLHPVRLLIRLLKTTSFRFAILNTILFVAAAAILGGFVYFQTFERELTRINSQLSEELELLDATFQNSGLNGLRRIIRGRINYRDNSLYILMVPPRFTPLEGNLSRIPVEAREVTAAFNFHYEKERYEGQAPLAPPVIEQRPALGRIVRLTDPGNGQIIAVLLVARDIQYIVTLRESARTLIFRLVVIVLLLGLGIGFFSARSLLGRLDNINRTAESIRKGELANRVPVTGSGDEFDELALNLNAMLAQIEKLMSGMREVSDNIAHDLRSPLTRIRNKIDQAIHAPVEDGTESLRDLSEDIDRLLATFNALLSITRIESGETGGLLKKTNMHLVIEEVADLYRPAIQEVGGELLIDIMPVQQIMASRELISQAVSNLLDNAIKHRCSDENAVASCRGIPSAPQPCNAEGLRVELKLYQKETGEIILAIRDNGPGIPFADRERVFHRFVRLERSRSSAGNGLGLSLVAAIAQAHGARIEVCDGLPCRKIDAESVPQTRPQLRNSASSSRVAICADAPSSEGTGYGFGVHLVFPRLSTGRFDR